LPIFRLLEIIKTVLHRLLIDCYISVESIIPRWGMVLLM
jgi:hypothetical protein